jgi:hypothetical protein
VISADDLACAGVAILRAKQHAARAKSKIEGRMAPEGLTWDRARDLADAAETLAYHATWMRNELLKRTQ